MSVASDTCRVCFNSAQNDNEALSDYTRSFKEHRKILQSYIGGTILETKAIEESRLARLQVEHNEEGSLDLMLG